MTRLPILAAVLLTLYCLAGYAIVATMSSVLA